MKLIIPFVDINKEGRARQRGSIQTSFYSIDDGVVSILMRWVLLLYVCCCCWCCCLFLLHAGQKELCVWCVAIEMPYIYGCSSTLVPLCTYYTAYHRCYNDIRIYTSHIYGDFALGNCAVINRRRMKRITE